MPKQEGAAYRGCHNMGPRERERRLATNQRIDRSHRRRSDSWHRPPSWTRGEKAVLVLSYALIVAVILAIVLFVLPAF